jgi:hypothetical protein
MQCCQIAEKEKAHNSGKERKFQIIEIRSGVFLPDSDIFLLIVGEAGNTV